MSVVPSMWNLMSSWCTPTVLFVLLNFMIATIFVSSGFGSHKHPQRLNNPDLQQHHHQPQLLNRSPSMLQRLKSFNFYQHASYYRSHEPAAPAQASYEYDAPMQAGQMEEEAAAYSVTADETVEHEHKQSQRLNKPDLQQHHHQPQLLNRSPSMLQRLKSFNLYQYARYYTSHEPAAPVQASYQYDTPMQAGQMEEEAAAYSVTSDETAEHEHKQPQRFNKPDLQQHHHQPQLLNRSPSMLQRLKSFNFYQYASYYRSHEPAAPVQASNEYDAPMQASQMKEEAAAYPVKVDETPGSEYEEELDGGEDECEAEDRFEQENGDKSLDEVYGQLQQGSHFNRTKSDTEPASGAVPVKLVKKMKKSASSKSAFRHFRESEILEARRPATVREPKARSLAAAEDDEEVDSKADDFINKFKQQLKLQRLNSILRYKEMVGQGAAK